MLISNIKNYYQRKLIHAAWITPQFVNLQLHICF